MTEAEFIAEFVRCMVDRMGGPGATFADGESVEDYAREVAPLYWAEEYQREEGPEACAESDMDCWE